MEAVVNIAHKTLRAGGVWPRAATCRLSMALAWQQCQPPKACGNPCKPAKNTPTPTLTPAPPPLMRPLTPTRSHTHPPRPWARIRGIGSTLRLKQRFGSGYQLAVSVLPPATTVHVDPELLAQRSHAVRAFFKVGCTLCAVSSRWGCKERGRAMHEGWLHVGAGQASMMVRVVYGYCTRGWWAPLLNPPAARAVHAPLPQEGLDVVPVTETRAYMQFLVPKDREERLHGFLAEVRGPAGS